MLNSAGGTVDNSGLIQAYKMSVSLAGAGLVADTGTIRSTGGNGNAAVQVAGGAAMEVLSRLAPYAARLAARDQLS